MSNKRAHVITFLPVFPWRVTYVQVFLEFLAEGCKRTGIGQTPDVLEEGAGGATTLHATYRMSDCRSRRQQLVLDCQAETSEQSLFSLSFGSLTSVREESSGIPMNSSCVEGGVFSGARGTISSVNKIRR